MGEVANQNDNQQQTSVSTKSQKVNAERQMHSDAKLQDTGNARLDLVDSTHEENEEFFDGDMHDNSDAKRNDMETRKEPVLEKYVRIHHPVDQIIGDKEARPI